jgi:uncharacterized protein YxjI
LRTYQALVREEQMELQSLNRLLVTQKLTMMVNRYIVTAPEATVTDGRITGDGPVVAFAEQKRMTFKEQVTVYTGQDKSQQLLGFKARQVMDFGATYDVTDAGGNPIGLFQKAFKASLTRSTWNLEQPGIGTIVGQERNQGIAILRRIWGFIPIIGEVPVPFIFHFDFQLDGKPMMSVEKRWGFRDRYDVTIHEPALDRRLVIAMTVALDALQSR